MARRLMGVNPPTRHIDINTVPRDGSEFIHVSRLQNALFRQDRIMREGQTLHVSPPTRLINATTEPEDGNEFILISRLRNMQLMEKRIIAEDFPVETERTNRM